MGLVEAARRTERQYGRDDGALPGYARLVGVYGAAVAGVGAALWRTGRRPAPVAGLDLVMLGLATHKIARIVAKDSVTSVVRAPFTEFVGSAGDSELMENVTGTGWRKSVGELVTCPFCLGPWVAGSLVAGSAVVPAVTKAVTTIFSAVAVSDFLQLGYAAAQQRQTPADQRARES